MIKLSDRQDIIGYMSWCEATGNSPFGEDEDDNQKKEENNEEIEIKPEKTKALKRENSKKRKDD